jgi:hypothetical protein
MQAIWIISKIMNCNYVYKIEIFGFGYFQSSNLHKLKKVTYQRQLSQLDYQN